MDFPGNSIHQPTAKPEQTQESAPEGEKKVVNKVISGTAIRRKKTLISRLRDLIVPEGKSLYETVVQGVLAPALKDMVNDAVIRGVETMIYGEPRSTGRRTSMNSYFRGPGGTSHINYNRHSSPTPQEHRPTMSSRGRARHDFGELALATRVEAEEILHQMDEIISRYGSVSVSDLYALIGENSHYTDEKWGWYNLHGADVRRDRTGSYLLILPDTEPLS